MWSNLPAYQGYFHSNDETLNKVWYSGEYTLQTNSVPVNTGRWVPMVHTGWANNGTLGPGDTTIVDGAREIQLFGLEIWVAQCPRLLSALAIWFLSGMPFK